MADELSQAAAVQQAGAAVVQAGGVQKAVPEPVSAIRPGNTPPKPAPDDDSPEARVQKLRGELAEAEAALPGDPGTVNVKVEAPHESFTVAGIVVGNGFAPVHAGWIPVLQRAAAGAGVTLTVEG